MADFTSTQSTLSHLPQESRKDAVRYMLRKGQEDVLDVLGLDDPVLLDAVAEPAKSGRCPS